MTTPAVAPSAPSSPLGARPKLRQLLPLARLLYDGESARST